MQKALPLMRDGGSIIMNGSIAHLKGMPGLSVYAGSKAALRSFARSWAVELAERRIRVNVLSPGPIATNALANLPAEAKEYFLSGIPRKELGHHPPGQIPRRQQRGERAGDAGDSARGRKKVRKR